MFKTLRKHLIATPFLLLASLASLPCWADVGPYPVDMTNSPQPGRSCFLFLMNGVWYSLDPEAIGYSESVTMILTAQTVGKLIQVTPAAPNSNPNCPGSTPASRVLMQ
jgi:hypothetical protein